MENKNKLTSKQLLTIPYIFNSSSIEEACRKAKICRGTYYLWLKDENFRDYLKEKRKEIVSEALDKLKTSIEKAVSALIKLTSSKNESISRLASRDIIEYALKAIEFEEFEGRLEKLEQTILTRR